MHVADMLDDRFGYEREIPTSDAGLSYDNILRDRYRVVWDTCIDGRLSHQHQVAADVRATRQQEFARVFPMLGAQAEATFVRWFDDPSPTHDAIVAFIQAPGAAGTGGRVLDGRCPICRFPSASLDPNPERLSLGALNAIQSDHPTWRPEIGLCSQCADLYGARSDRGSRGSTA